MLILGYAFLLFCFFIFVIHIGKMLKEDAEFKDKIEKILLDKERKLVLMKAKRTSAQDDVKIAKLRKEIEKLKQQARNMQ